MLKLLFTINILCLALFNTIAQSSDSLSRKYYETAPSISDFNKKTKPISSEIDTTELTHWMLEPEIPILKTGNCLQEETYDLRKQCSDMALKHFIQSNLQYPKEAREMSQEGKVFIRAIINEEGKMENIEVAKNMTNSDLLAKEAIRLLNQLNQEMSWEPGRQRNQAVKVRLIIPVVFKLD